MFFVFKLIYKIKMEQTHETPKRKPFNFFGFGAKDILGLMMIITGFFLILIGVFMIAYNLLSKTPTQQQPPPMQQKKKKPPKKRPEEQQSPPIDVEKKENEIKQNASNILLEEYTNTMIPTTIIQESDTESELEVRDDHLDE